MMKKATCGPSRKMKWFPMSCQIQKNWSIWCNACAKRLRHSNASKTESIDECVQRKAKSEQDYKRYSWQLAQLLLGPVALRGKKRIIFVPEGPLQYVPFSALPLRDVHGKSSILADKHEVVILPSASALAAIRKAAKNRPRPSLPAAESLPIRSSQAIALAPSASMLRIALRRRRSRQIVKRTSAAC